jgi:phosphocarrier protein
MSSPQTPKPQPVTEVLAVSRVVPYVARPTDFHAMQKNQVKVTNALGIHARPSAKITQLASRFNSSMWLGANGRRANARSIVAVMLLAAADGSTITIETSGPDEKEAIDALTDLIGRGFAAKR